MRLKGIEIIQENQQYVLKCQVDDLEIYFHSTHFINSQDGDLLYDAFVIALIPLMLEKNESLVVDGLVDEVLLTQINTKVLPKLCEIQKFKNSLTVTALETVKRTAVNDSIVVTGISCGVDSLATIKELEDCNDKLDYLTFFDAGSHGKFGTDNTELTYHHRLGNAEVAAEKIGLKIIEIRTNAHSFLKGRFKTAHSFLNISCAFATQGFINEYHYASAYSIEQSNQQSGDTSNFDHYILPELYSSYFNTKSTLGDKNRIERIEYIYDYKVAQEHLDVCTNSILAKKEGRVNCTVCEKCMRTALTLDILGFLTIYEKVFDLKVFEMNKVSYIASLLVGDKSEHDNELLNLLKRKDQLRLNHKITALKAILKKRLKSILRFVSMKRN